MYLRKINLMIFTLLIFLVWVFSALTQTYLQYQNRGNRHEGIKPILAAGYDIELISVLVDYEEKIEQMPDLAKLRFYLEGTSAVYLTVRERETKTFYWLDQIKPREPWKSEAYNGFEWPTRDVIQPLKLEMYDLGVIARLANPIPMKLEEIAPVILYHTTFPDTIDGYLFTFKIRQDANLEYSVYRDNDAEAVFTQPYQKKSSPFTLAWRSPKSPKGWYKLVVRGYFLNNNVPIYQAVHFYHNPDAR